MIISRQQNSMKKYHTKLRYIPFFKQCRSRPNIIAIILKLLNKHFQKLTTQLMSLLFPKFVLKHKFHKLKTPFDLVKHILYSLTFQTPNFKLFFFQIFFLFSPIFLRCMNSGFDSSDFRTFQYSGWAVTGFLFGYTARLFGYTARMFEYTAWIFCRFLCVFSFKKVIHHFSAHIFAIKCYQDILFKLLTLSTDSVTKKIQSCPLTLLGH